MAEMNIMLATLVALTLAGPTWAEAPPTMRFLNDAIQSDIGELKLAQLVQQKAQDPSVRAYAATLSTDYAEAKAKAEALAQKVGLLPPTQPRPSLQQEYSRLAGLSGQSFDRAFVQVMIDDHRRSIASYNEASHVSRNPEVVDLARTVLPDLKKHLELAQLLKRQTGAVQPADKPKAGG